MPRRCTPLRAALAVAALAAHAAAQALPSPPLAGELSFAVALGAPAGPPVPPNFIGFSWETKNAAVMLADGGAPRAPLINLLRGLAAYSGAAGPHVRVGGNSADLSEWAPDPAAPLVLINDTLRITPDDMAALAQGVPLFNGSVTVALNMRSPDDPTVAVAHATAAADALGYDLLLESFEVGNEPDVFVANGIRPPGYTSAAYAAEFARYAAALGAAGVPPRRLRAPTTQGGWNGTWFPPFLADVAVRADNLSAVATHFYALSVCTAAQRAAPPGPALLLADDAASATARALARMAPYAAAAAAVGLPFHVGEGSAVACSGSPGTADSMPAPLWLLDTCFALFATLNVTRFDFHGGPTGDNSALRFPVRGVNPTRYDAIPQVAPLFYGMHAFTYATARNARLLPVTASAAANASAVRAWAVQDDAGDVRVVLVNKQLNATGAADVTLTLSVPLRGNATVAALLPGPGGMAATSGLTWRGQTWDGTTDGMPSGAVTTTQLAPTSPGVFRVALPVASALVLTLPSAAEQPPAPPAPPAPPPAPPATAAATRIVRAAVMLSGLSAAAFDAPARAAFVAALAGALRVAPADVSITAVADAAAAPPSTRHRQLQQAPAAGGVSVAFAVLARDDDAAAAVQAGVAATLGAGGGAAFAATLRGAGLAAVTGAQLTLAPTVAPLSSPARAAGRGRALLHALGAACAALALR